jgi:4-carboxymuconolactone decarboxylase
VAISQSRIAATRAGASRPTSTLLEMWRTSDAFSDEERAALALTDAIVEGNVTTEIIAELDRHFSHAQRVELTVTAGFYAMVPRVLDALGVPVER